MRKLFFFIFMMAMFLVSMAQEKDDFNKPVKIFIAKQVRYPVEAQEGGIHGDVVLEFTITSDGNIEKISVVETSSEILTKEVVRALLLSKGKWEIKQKDGVLLTPLREQIKISFKLQGGRGNNYGIEDAKQMLLEARSKSNEGKVKYLMNKAIKKKTQGDLESALKLVSKAIDLDPKTYKLYQYRSQLYKELGNEEESLNDLTIVTALKKQKIEKQQLIKQQIEKQQIKKQQSKESNSSADIEVTAF